MFTVPAQNERPLDAAEWTFADWFGADLTGETYDGDIQCSWSDLTSLKGAPKVVRGSFDCSNNHLTSLEHAPQKVGRYFWCSSNELTSLKGAPKEVNGTFHCDFNRLSSLNGIGDVKGEIYSKFQRR